MIKILCHSLQWGNSWPLARRGPKRCQPRQRQHSTLIRSLTTPQLMLAVRRKSTQSPGRLYTKVIFPLYQQSTTHSRRLQFRLNQLKNQPHLIPPPSNIHTMSSFPSADSQINHANAKQYWQSIDADVNGMLGGYPYVSRVDLQGSRNFLAKLGVGARRSSARVSNGVEAGSENNSGKLGRAVDCGAG